MAATAPQLLSWSHSLDRNRSSVAVRPSRSWSFPISTSFESISLSYQNGVIILRSLLASHCQQRLVPPLRNSESLSPSLLLLRDIRQRSRLQRSPLSSSSSSSFIQKVVKDFLQQTSSQSTKLRNKSYPRKQNLAATTTLSTVIMSRARYVSLYHSYLFSW